MVQSAAANVEEYLAELPHARAVVISDVRELVLGNLPDGVEESMNFGMIAYEIPLSRYPDTYNGQPLMFAALAAQKNHYALYLHGVYSSEPIAERLRRAYDEAGMKLDMGKSCVRFKRPEQLLASAIAEAISATSVADFISLYESAREL